MKCLANDYFYANHLRRKNNCLNFLNAFLNTPTEREKVGINQTYSMRSTSEAELSPHV